MAAQPPRPSARNAGVRAGAAAPSGNGAQRAGPGHAAQAAADSLSDTNSKEQKSPGTFFLGRYRVVEEIGVGGMASVHLARMDGPGGFQKWVAIKRIHPNLVEDDQFVDMFLDEARIAAGINHANVAQVFDLGKDEGTYWIAMEYLHGEPLRELMRRSEERSAPISCDVAARVCADAAEGLHAAHELRGKNGQLLNLVHRDVTPHNLFITYEGYTKVVDFGIAKVADRLSETRAGTLKGKLAYMSPEQVRGQEDVDRTTDVFALGVVLWELTTGHRLFRMDTDLDTLEKVQACVVPPPSTIVSGYPIELESVVMKALAKKKPERYQTAREFSRALQMYLQRRSVLIGPEEVSAFVRDMFADRIKAREAHLAWAADVTSTINIDQLNAMKSNRATARMNDGFGDNVRDQVKNGGRAESLLEGGGPRPVGIAEVGKPSIPGSNVPSIRASSNGLADVPAPPPQSRRPPPPPPTVKGGGGNMNSLRSTVQGLPNPPPPPQGSHPPQQQPQTRAGVQSLVDDDEDIPTTVATREQVRDLSPTGGPPPPQRGQRPPLPAAGSRNNNGNLPSFGPPPPAPGNQGPGNQSTGQTQQPPHGFSSTVALQPGQNSQNPLSGMPGVMAPTFGAPQANGQTNTPQPAPSHPGYGTGPMPVQSVNGPFNAQNNQTRNPANSQHAAGQMNPMAFGGRGFAPPQGQHQGHPNNGHPNAHTVAMGQGQPPQGAQHSIPELPSFGPPPSMSQGFMTPNPPNAQNPNAQNTNAQNTGHPGQSGNFQTPHQHNQNGTPVDIRGNHPHMNFAPPPSAVETALSLPRPEGNALWAAAPQAAKHSDRMSTAVLIAVAVLTAICVLALGALIYVRYRDAAPQPAGALDLPPSGSITL